jgi:hypothetical protein
MVRDGAEKRLLTMRMLTSSIGLTDRLITSS